MADKPVTGIRRTSAGCREVIYTKKINSNQREQDDFDLQFDFGNEVVNVYVLAEHEYYDPRTSSKGRHMMCGPSLIINASGAGSSTTEYWINDPHGWERVRYIMEAHAKHEPQAKVME